MVVRTPSSLAISLHPDLASKRSETQALLAENSFSSISSPQLLGSKSPDGTSTTCGETAHILSLSLPLSTAEILSFTAYLITTSQVGHLGKLELSALILARTIYHVTGLTLAVGLSTGIKTLCGQAYGARQYQLVGVILQRAVLINIVLSILSLILWTQAKPLMAMIGTTDQPVIHRAAEYLWAMSPSLMIQGTSYCFRFYLASQGVVRFLTITSLMETLLLPLYNWVLIYRAGWGGVGAAVALDVVAASEMLMLLAYVCWMHCMQPLPHKTWGGFSARAALSGWREYLRISLPSMAMTALDWWSFDGLVLIAGLQQDAEVALAAMGVCVNTHALVFLISAGFSGAASIRVSNELGAGHGRYARHVMSMCVGFGMAGAIASGCALLIGRHQWARLFTPDKDVVAVVAAAIPFLCISLVGDSCNTILSGGLQGAGRQLVGMAVNFLMFWCIGLPFAAFLDLKLGYGAQGLWQAMGMTSTLQALLLVAVMYGWLKWDHEAARAKALVAANAGSSHDDAYSSGTVVEEGDFEKQISNPQLRHYSW